MRIFRCGQCGQALYFENVSCLRCGSLLAFLPDQLDLGVITPDSAGRPGLWHAQGQDYRLCLHRTQTQSCNFAIPAHDPQGLCASCRLTLVLPDLSVPGNFSRWFRLESAKRRLFFTLAQLRLLDGDPAGASTPRQAPGFKFLADLPGQPAITGHDAGVITINIGEADDDERARRQAALHEPYRTVLGHLRHESGHFYWDQLIAKGPALERFRQQFGDERANYARALTQHYERDPGRIDWQAAHVSAYATAHPWEDWAETWAHYLHMVDLVDTANSFGTRIELPGAGSIGARDPAIVMSRSPDAKAFGFEQMVRQWVPLTILVNSLNRSLGQDDAYPFALSPAALDKLRFVHEVVSDAAKASPASPGAP